MTRWHAAQPPALLLAILLTMLACRAPAGRERAAPPATRPNVVLIVADSLRADHLGVYGAARPTSPNIDRLARSSLLCRRAYSQAPWTPSSMASVMTGTYQSVHQVTHYLKDGYEFSVLDGGFDTLAELFQRAGYRTAAFSSQAWLLPETGFAQGFDEFAKVSGISDPYETETVVGAGIGWIAANRRSPFFVYLHILNPHFPYEPPEPFSHLWDRGPPPERLRAGREMSIDDRWERLTRLGREPQPPTREEIAYLETSYDTAIAYVDYWIGVLVRQLKAMGLAERTLVAFTSDHGESFGEHRQFGHSGSIYNDQLHVPLILSHPVLFSQRREIDPPVELIDLYPTLASLAGLEFGDQIQGQDLLAAPPRGLAFSEGVKLSEFKLQSGAWSLIVDRDLRGFQLFDLAADPGETVNLWQEGSPPAEELRRELFAVIERNRSHPWRVERPSRQLDEEILDELRALGYIE